MGFIAVYFPNSEMNKDGFETEEEAWKYAHSFDCDICSCNTEFNSCIAEWDVFNEDDY